MSDTLDTQTLEKLKPAQADIRLVPLEIARRLLWMDNPKFQSSSAPEDGCYRTQEYKPARGLYAIEQKQYGVL